LEREGKGRIGNGSGVDGIFARVIRKKRLNEGKSQKMTGEEKDAQGPERKPRSRRY